MKYNKFRDIPRYIRANYQVDYPLSYFEKWLKEEEEEAGLQLNRFPAWSCLDRSAADCVYRIPPAWRQDGS